MLDSGAFAFLSMLGDSFTPQGWWHMQLSHGGSVGVDIPKSEPGCVRIQMASKTSHMERVLTDDEAYQFAREIVSTLAEKEKAACRETRMAVEQAEKAGEFQDVPVAFAEYTDVAGDMEPSTVPSIESVQDPRD